VIRTNKTFSYQNENIPMICSKNNHQYQLNQSHFSMCLLIEAKMQKQKLKMSSFFWWKNSILIIQTKQKLQFFLFFPT